jgi:thioredoxin 2
MSTETNNNVITSCPACGAGNRIPKARLADRPVCGRCRQPMFSGRPVDLNDASFQRMISGSLPVVVDFWAPWCGPCRTMGPEFERAAAQLEPEFRLARVNTEEAQAAASQHGIRSIPTMVVFRDGREVARHSGAVPSSEIVRWAEAAVSG